MEVYLYLLCTYNHQLAENKIVNNLIRQELVLKEFSIANSFCNFVFKPNIYCCLPFMTYDKDGGERNSSDKGSDAAEVSTAGSISASTMRRRRRGITFDLRLITSRPGHFRRRLTDFTLRMWRIFCRNNFIPFKCTFFYQSFPHFKTKMLQFLLSIFSLWVYPYFTILL